MLHLKETLYHGTIYEIDQVNVFEGNKRRDFGQGFYMAVSKEQAIGMMHKKYREAKTRKLSGIDISLHERLYEIDIDTELAKSLKVKTFDYANMEWLEFVLMCREKGKMPHDYDIVIGPTADDDTMFCLKAYWDGLYGKVGSDDAKRILLSNLEPDNLGIQYYIGKQDVADRLIKEIRLIKG